MLNIAIVGAGYIGQNHIAAYKAREDVSVVAIICRNAERGNEVAAQVGGECKHFASLEAALAEKKIDIVDICTPTNLHEEYAVKAANAKCHVLCEKPVTFDVESFDRMAGACKENGVKFMVAQVVRWAPEYMEIKKYLDEGKVGDVHMVYAKRICQHPTWSTWHRKPEVSGGGLYDLGVHDIDYLYSVFGLPVSVYSSGWKSSTGCWNHVVTNFVWAGGQKAVLESSLEMTGNFPFSATFRCTGDKGTLCYDLVAGVNINDGDMGTNLIWYPADTGETVPVVVEGADMFAGEIGAFVEAVKNDTPTPIAPEESRDVLRMVVAMKQSLETGEVVKL